MRTNNALIQVARSTILQFSRRFVAHCQPGPENPADCIWADFPYRQGLPAVAGAPRDRDISVIQRAASQVAGSAPHAQRRLAILLNLTRVLGSKILGPDFAGGDIMGWRALRAELNS